KARALLLEITDGLLRDGPDPELEALYDRHSDVPHAELRQLDVDMAEIVVEEIFGPEATRGHNAQNVEELLRHAGERIAEADAKEREASANRTRRGRPSRADERKAQAAREASQSVREIYRKLAS